MKSKKVYFVAMLAALALSGCASEGQVKGGGEVDEDSSVLQTRAVERWNLLIAHKAEKAWDYLSPGYRATKPRDAYAEEMNNRPIRWTKTAFTSQQCEADTCKVFLSVDYNVNLGGPAGRLSSFAPVAETWVKVKGRWYYLPEQFEPTKLGDKS